MKDILRLYEERLLWAEQRDAGACIPKDNATYIKPAEFDIVHDKLMRKNKLMLVAEKGWGKSELAQALYWQYYDSDDFILFGDLEKDIFYSQTFCSYIKRKVGVDVLENRRIDMNVWLHNHAFADEGRVVRQDALNEIDLILHEEKTRFTWSEIYTLSNPLRYKTTDPKDMSLIPEHQVYPVFIIYDFHDAIALDKRLFWKRLAEIDKVRERFNYCGVLALAVPVVYDNYSMDKWDAIIAKNYSVEKLIEIYKKRWSSSFPFNEDALLQVASVSKGLPRIFKSNIAHCLNKFKHLELITRDMVIQAGVAEDIASSLMRQAFKNKGYLELASLMLEHFKLTGSCNSDCLRDYLVKRKKSVPAANMMLSRFYKRLSEACLIEEPERSGKGSKIFEVIPSKRLKEYL